MLRDRPCGACHALVPADTGCKHWKPGVKAPAPVKRRPMAANDPRMALLRKAILDRGASRPVE